MAKRALPVNGGAGRSAIIRSLQGQEMSAREIIDPGTSTDRPRRALRGRAGRMQGGRGSGPGQHRRSAAVGPACGRGGAEEPGARASQALGDARGHRLARRRAAGQFPGRVCARADLARLVARDAPHQGLVLECAPLPDLFLADVLDGDPARPLLVLDQVTDPHNVGAILRSAAAFNACAHRHPGPPRPARIGHARQSRRRARWKSCPGCAW